MSCFASACSKGTDPALDASQDDESVFQEAGWRRTELYYLTDEGLMVPIIKQIPWEEGIGKAALNQLVCSAENSAAAAGMGLSPVLPDGVSFELRINDAEMATVNIIGLKNIGSAEKERAMVTAVVNTLLAFPTIESVAMKFDGKKLSKLKYGTVISEGMTYMPLNVEEGNAAVMTGEHSSLRLYFPSSACSLNIPVTRYISETPSFELAVSELMKGSSLSAIPNFFPADLELLDAKIVDDVATVNFSKGFKDVLDTPGLALALHDAIYLTACEFGSVSELNIKVEGKKLDIDGASLSAPLYVNEFRS